MTAKLEKHIYQEYFRKTLLELIVTILAEIADGFLGDKKFDFRIGNKATDHVIQS